MPRSSSRCALSCRRDGLSSRAFSLSSCSAAVRCFNAAISCRNGSSAADEAADEIALISRRDASGLSADGMLDDMLLWRQLCFGLMLSFSLRPCALPLDIDIVSLQGTTEGDNEDVRQPLATPLANRCLSIPLPWPPFLNLTDWMAERSKAPRSGRGLVRGVGSNPTSVKT